MRLPLSFAKYLTMVGDRAIRAVGEPPVAQPRQTRSPDLAVPNRAGRDVILLELNEVPNLILNRYVVARPRSSLAWLLSRSRRFTTNMKHSGMLEPWTAWPTFHRGVDNTKHGVFALGQPTRQIDEQFPPVWSLLHRVGIRVGVFGSLLARLPQEAMRGYSFFVPDFFHHEFHVHPDSLAAFQTLNLRMTRASRHSVDRHIPFGDATRLLIHARRMGIRPGTFAHIGAQLLSEIRRPHLKLRRRLLQNRLMGDAFIHVLDTRHPQFATFFTNHVATSLHRFWGAAFPNDWSFLPLSDDYRQRFRDEVWVAMDVFDELLGRTLAIARRRAALVTIASAFGQQPIPTYHAFSYMTITDLPQFMSGLGFRREEWRSYPTMAPHFSIEVAPDRALQLAARLRQVRIDGHEMTEHTDIQWPLCFRQLAPGFFTLYFQVDDYAGPREVEFGNERLAFAEAGISEDRHEHGIEYTAYHTQEGSLSIYDPLRHLSPTQSETIDAVDYVPSLLRHFGVPVPEYMEGRCDLFI